MKRMIISIRIATGGSGNRIWDCKCIGDIDTLLEEGKSSVLDVIEFENAKDIGTGLYQIEKCMKGSRLGSELLLLLIILSLISYCVSVKCQR